MILPESGEEPRVPEEGDLIEASVGPLWLLARVRREAYCGPGVPEGWSGGLFHFDLVNQGGGSWSSCAYVVGDWLGPGRAWRWPLAAPGTVTVATSPTCGCESCESGECAAHLPEAAP